MGSDDRFYYPDDDPYHDEPPQEAEPQDQTPASVIFMEMMRKAAANRYPTADAPVYQTSESPQPTVAPAAEPADAERRRAAAMEAQRIRRVQRRRARRRYQTVSTIGGFFRTLVLAIISGGLIATILSWWTSPQALDESLRASLGQVVVTQPAALPVTAMPTPNWLRQIGIVSGHRGPENDPGAVCPDGLTENEINFAVAQLVVLELRGRGYSVDLLDEFDSRLDGYRGAALVSIHSNDCRDYGEYVSGYLVAQAEARPQGGEDSRLVECLATHYGQVSGLQRREGLTRDMTDYHIFREISPTTPGAIIELGFMLGDREILVNQPDVLARGIVDGIVCFLEREDTPPAESIETPTPGGA